MCFAVCTPPQYYASAGYDADDEGTRMAPTPPPPAPRRRSIPSPPRPPSLDVKEEEKVDGTTTVVSKAPELPEPILNGETPRAPRKARSSLPLRLPGVPEIKDVLDGGESPAYLGTYRNGQRVFSPKKVLNEIAVNGRKRSVVGMEDGNKENVGEEPPAKKERVLIPTPAQMLQGPVVMLKICRECAEISKRSCPTEAAGYNGLYNRVSFMLCRVCQHETVAMRFHRNRLTK